MELQNDSAVLSYENLIDHSSTAEVKPLYPWLYHPVTLLFVLISAVGNISVFALVCLSTTFRRPSNYLIGNLCVASVYFMCVFSYYNVRNDVNVTWWEYNSVTCPALGFIQRLVLPILPYTITAISLDRSKAARNPLDHATNRTILMQILFIWTLGFVLNVPRIAIYKYDEHVDGAFKCKKVPLGGSSTLQTIYAVIVLTFVYLLPAYILIKEFITLRTKMRFLTLSQVEQKKRFQHRIRLMQNSCIFTAIFIVCWLPQGIFQFPFDLSREVTEKLGGFVYPLKIARDISRQVVFLNTCLNPVLLLLLSFELREYLTTCSV